MASNRSFVAIGAIVAAAGMAHAQQDIFWANPNGGVWSNAANWSPSTVPNNNGENLFNATLDLQQNPYMVMLDIDVTLQNFSLLWGGATLNLMDRQFTVNQDLNIVDGTLTRGATSSALTVVTGRLGLNGAALMNAGNIVSNGALEVGGESQVDICNTGVDHRGTGGISWSGSGNINIDQGGSLTNGIDSTFSVTGFASKAIIGDGTGQVVNRGTLINQGESRGLPSVLEIIGVEFLNTGTLTVQAGGIALNTVNDLTDKGALTQGTWNVLNSTFLSFGDWTVDRLATKVNIDGEGAQFFGFEGVSEITEEGSLNISGGKNFQTITQFRNDGILAVGADSTFDTSEFGLGNFDGNGLYGGEYIIEGDFFTGNRIVERLQADVTLIGAESVFEGIDFLREIGGSGRLALEEGRVLDTFGDFSVEDGGRVKVGLGSTLNVTGLLNNNDANGLFDAAAFEVQGTLIATNLNIVEISNELILDGVGSELRDAAGNDAIAGLNRIREDGILRLRDGRSLTGIDNLIVEGILSIEGAGGTGRGDSSGTVQVDGSILFTPGSMLEIVINGSSDDAYGKVLAGDARIEGVATLSLVVNPGAGLQFGDELILLKPGTEMIGTFASIEGLDIGGGLSFEVYQGSDGIIARVVPVPGVTGLLGFAGLLASRRRRS